MAIIETESGAGGLTYRYAYDQVLGVYYAKARMYDAANRRFMAMDPAR